MKVAIVHYHLRKGGVTRVIESATAGLRAHGVELVVLTGEAYGGDAWRNAVVVEGLGYRKSGDAELAGRLADAARQALGAAPDVWHVHNHSLGKNVAMPAAAAQLPGPVLLQIHDFAEDGRPANYAGQRKASSIDQLYPSAPRFHYATLNQRDAAILRGAGVSEDRLHLLPNAVSAPPAVSPGDPPFPEADRFLLYPVRGIRRKNLGELALLSLLAGPKTAIATTLRPQNREWRPVHDEWARFMERQQLPVHLGVCDGGEFGYSQLVAAADALLTTSVAEGFGLAFLEPWLAGKSVLGRNLPAITADFRGVSLDHLYDRLAVPLAAIDELAFREALQNGLAASFQAYDRDLPPGAVDRAWAAAVGDDGVDFGCLNEALQRQALENLIANPRLLAQVDSPTLDPVPEPVIRKNAALIELFYDLETYGDRLVGIYQKVRASAAVDSTATFLDADAILDSFLSPESFKLLRT